MKQIFTLVIVLIFFISCTKDQGKLVEIAVNSEDKIDDSSIPLEQVQVQVQIPVEVAGLSIEPWPYDESLHETVKKYLPSMVSVPATTFRLGTDNPENKPDEASVPSHEVSLRQFYMAETLVTVDLWDMFLTSTGYTGYTGTHAYWGSLEDNSIGGQSAVIFMTWDEAVYFCNWLSDVCGLERVYELSGSLDPKRRGGIEATWIRNRNGFRLITEAEWELVNYEGGKDTAWLRQRYSEFLNRQQPSKVPVVQEGPLTSYGIRVYPNFGIREWTWDTEAPYTTAAQIDPTGGTGLISGGKSKVNRFFHTESFYNRLSSQTEGGEGEFITIRLAQDKQ